MLRVWFSSDGFLLLLFETLLLLMKKQTFVDTKCIICIIIPGTISLKMLTRLLVVLMKISFFWHVQALKTNKNTLKPSEKIFNDSKEIGR